MTRAEVLDKIRKLMAHAESAQKIGSEQEAISFAAKAQTLMREYGVSYVPPTSDPGPTHILFRPDDHGVKTCRRCPQWQAYLGEVTSRICLVKAVWLGNTNSAHFVGREELCRAACVTHAYLIKLAIAAATEAVRTERAFRRLRTLKSRRRFRSSFLLGFANRLMSSVIAARRDTGEAALVRLDQIEREAQEYANRLGNVHSVSVHPSQLNSRAVRLGRLAADEVDLSGSRSLGPGKTVGRG